jgi:ATP-dependent protease ClpP protease subunit
LAKESNLTDKQMKRMIQKKMNIYFDAEKAIEYGIADSII